MPIRYYMIMLYTNKRHCPLIQEPSEECYCNKMNSQDIERTIYFCSRNYESCTIYRYINNKEKDRNTEIRVLTHSLI